MQLGNSFAGAAGQAWLRLWVGLYGDGSRLARYLQPELPPPALPLPPAPLLRARRAPVEPRQRLPGARPSARVARAIAKPKVELPLPEWAKQLIGDQRIADITLDDLLLSIEDYFETFSQMKRVNRQAYHFFSRVGAPIITRNSMAWTKQCDAARFPGAHSLPAMFGIFLATATREDARERVGLDGKNKSGPDFVLFEKLRNAPTVAPAGSTIFAQGFIYLRRRGIMSPQEEKQHAWARRSFGANWYVGVDRDGAITALPCLMRHTQVLPRADRKDPNGGPRVAYVHRSAFEIPQGLYELGDGNPHEWARHIFCAAVAFSASAASGLQVAIRRDKETIRIGIPITAARGFFGDRDRGNAERRSAILHLRRPHERQRADGSTTIVGAHLAGERQFTWRGYQVSIGAPGLHYPAPEGFTDGVWDPDEKGVPPDKDIVDATVVAKVMQKEVWRQRRTRFRRGRPTKLWVGNSFPDAQVEASDG